MKKKTKKHETERARERERHTDRHGSDDRIKRMRGRKAKRTRKEQKK